MVKEELMKSLLFACLAIALAPWPAGNAAAAYPDAPIRIIVPFGPGDAIDGTARVIADRMKAELKVPVVVQNVPGAGGGVGTAEANRAKHDGYTLLMGSTGALTARPMIGDAGYQTEDFVPIAQLVVVPIGLAVAANSPYTSLKQLVEAAKTKTLTYSTPGPGSTQHINMSRFAQDGGLKLTHVGGRGGKGAVTKTLTGEVDFVFVGASNYTALEKGGKLRVLAVAAPKRVPYLPEVPTFHDQGYDLDAAVWFGLLVNSGTPQDRIEKLRDTIDKIAREDATLALYRRLNFTPAYLEGEISVWRSSRGPAGCVMWRLRRADGVLGLAALAAAVLLGVLSADIPVNLGVQTLSARFFPRLLALVLAVAGLALVLAPGPRAVTEAVRALLERRRLQFAVAVMVYFLTFRYVDFRVGTFAFMVVTMWLFGSRKWHELIVVPLAVSAGAFVLFRYGFTVLLPTWG
jgi:tripartite-type tricarboxylate transporter receptor subunit TctC